MKQVIRFVITLVLLCAVTPVQGKPLVPSTELKSAIKSPSSNIELVGHYGGRSSTLSVTDDFAMLGAGTELSIWDITNPVTPTQIGGVSLPAIPQDIAIAGHLAYVADGFGGGLQIVDFSDISNPSVGSSVITHAVNTVAISGTYAYVTTWDSDPFNSSLRVYDVTSPTLPIESDVITTSSLVHDLVITGTYGYIAMTPDNITGTLKILDLSTPAHPTIINSINTFCHDLDISGNFAYALCGYALQVLDISNPMTPTLVSTYTASVTGSDIAAAGDYIYLQGHSQYTTGEGVLILDISNPFNPVEAGFLPGPWNVASLVVSEGRAYLVDGDGLHIADVTNPANPVELSYTRLMGYIKHVTAGNRYVYLSNGSASGLWVVDATNPGIPVNRDIVPITSIDAKLAGQYLYVLGPGTPGYYGLHILETTNPANPTQVGSLPLTGEKIDVTNGYAYITIRQYENPFPPPTPGHFRIVDVSMPANPAQVFDIEGSFLDVATASHYAYVVKENEGLEVWDVSNPISPTLTGMYTYTANINDGYVAVSGDHAYVTTQGELRVVDVSDPRHPTEVGALTIPTGDLAVSVGYVFIAAGWDGLRMVSVSDPTHPAEVGHFDTSYWAYEVDAYSDKIYLATLEGGLLIFRLGPGLFHQINLPITINADGNVLHLP